MQKDRVDKSAHGWEHHEKLEKHESQSSAQRSSNVGRLELKIPAQSDQDDEQTQDSKKPVEIVKGDAKSLRARFEGFAQQSETAAKEKMEAEKKRRLERESVEKEIARQAELDRQEKLKQIESERGDQEEDDEEQVKNDDEDNELPVKSPLINRIGVSVFPMSSPTNVQVPTSPIKVAPQTPTVPTAAPILETAQLASHLHQGNEEDEDNDEDEWKVGDDVQQVAHSDSMIIHGAATTPEPQLSKQSTESGQDLGITATAMYDYEASESDEITFDPDEQITHIEMIDEGWWRGQCRGKFGLFPANYVKLNE